MIAHDNTMLIINLKMYDDLHSITNSLKQFPMPPQKFHTNWAVIEKESSSK